MIETGIDTRVKVNQIIESQLPSYVSVETPKAVDFLKQYYKSQDSQGSPGDLIDNLDQYLKFDNITSDIVSGVTTLTSAVSSSDTVVNVESTKGYPNKDGVFKINNEIIYYTGITTNSFTGCIRGFSGISNYSNGEVIFKETEAEAHTVGMGVTNLSTLFLREFFRNLKVLYAPGFEDESFDEDLNINNLVKNLKSFYQSKGTGESINTLISILFGQQSSVRKQSEFLFEPSQASFRRRLVLVAEKVGGGNPLNLSGQTLFQDDNENSTEINGASAPISEVENTIRGGRSYYTIYLYQRYQDPSPGFEGTFAITPQSKCIGDVLIGDDVITVDSTIGFPKSGVLVSGTNVITYTDKTITQFLGCSGITQNIPAATSIRTNDIVYGYTTDTNEKVELRLTGVISEFDPQEQIYNAQIGEIYRTKSIGANIENPSSEKTYEEISFNSWKYNTASSIEVNRFNGSVFVLGRDLDDAYLRNGDNVEIVNRGDREVVVGLATVSITGNREVVLSGDGITNLVQGRGYDIRRIVKKASSSGIELEYGNDKLLSNILNTYITKDKSEIYVASNSLPDYNIDLNQVESSIAEASLSSGSIEDLDTDSGNYNIVSFPTNVPFITGDEVVYSAGTATDPIEGLEFGRSYFIEVLSPNNKVKLYVARSFIDSGRNIKVNVPLSGDTGSHVFSLEEQVNKKINPQKILKKFSLIRSLDTGAETSTVAGACGILENGVEVTNYKTDDKVFFGPVEKVDVFNSGKNYDVVTPPKLVISGSDNAGRTAAANVAVRGTLQDILIDPQEFSIDQVLSVTVSGGNGSGARVEPIVLDVFREVGFNGKNASDGGGVSVYFDSIRTINNHNFGNGEEVVYDPNGNKSIAITGFGQTNFTGNFLETGGKYFTEIIDPTSFRLYESIADFNSGINTVGFSTGSNSGGFHKFRTANQTKQITGVNVLASGSGYENRAVAIQTTGITTSNNSFNFKNHGYSTGELVTYSASGDKIPELSTEDQYYILKIDDNNFRIANAGVAGTNPTNFNRGLAERFTGIGTGLHTFNYPPVTVDVAVSIANTVGVVTATPVVKGEIIDTLLYDGGSSYGSKVLNFHKRPTVDIKTGTGVELQPVIVDKKIIDILVTQPGTNYFSPPDVVITSESGSGCKARALVNDNGNVTDVIILRTGNNYVASNTSAEGVSRGSGALLRPSVRNLTINNRVRFADYNGEALVDKGENGLQYCVVGYNPKLQADFQDLDSTKHSPLIGWAYDGNPIYGCYGYTDPDSTTSIIKLIESGYTIDITQVEDRPSGFESGLFLEDYIFNDSGDLDKHNGRFTKTPEFPNGTYAYFATLKLDSFTGDLVSSFPYFVGNSYRSNIVPENLAGSSISLTQDFDFIGNELIRNTFPYNVAVAGADYDFFTQPYNFDNQDITVQSRSTGGVTDLAIVNKGRNYKVGDSVVFDNTRTTGGAVAAQVFEVTGTDVQSITKEFLTYDKFVFETLNDNQVIASISTYHDLEGGNIVKISGLSTYVAQLAGDKSIGVPIDDFSLTENVPLESVGGMATDLPVSRVPEFLRPNTEIEINDETVTVLNVFKPLNIFGRFNNIIRVKRGTTGSGHTVGAALTVKPSQFIFSFDGATLDSKPNDVVYFNPTEAVGFGTTIGIAVDRSYEIGGITTDRSIPTYSIYLENHPFVDNQQIKIIKPGDRNPIAVSTVGAGATFNLPISGQEQLVYVVNKGPNIIGIKTTLDSTEINFISCDSDDYEYQVQSNFKQITGKVERLTARVSTGSSHGLQKDDSVKFEVKPNLTVGIGTSTAVRIKFEEFIQNVVVDQIGFSSSSVGLSSSRFNIESHGLVTGDLVFYNADETTGIDTGKYFVFSGDPDSFSLAETLTDLSGETLTLVGFTTVGGSSHTISKVNPEIEVTRNNSLKFDLSDPTLSGYNFKIFYDKEYRNEIVGTGQSTAFEIIGIGTVGLGTASATIQFNEYLPEQLFYNLEKISDNTLVESDDATQNFSRILYVDSEYSKQTTVVGLGTTVTTFLINLPDKPEKDSYVKSEVQKIEYTTRSTSAFGGISKLDILSQGFEYDRLPGISTITSEIGIDAELIPKSQEIGRLNLVEVKKPGFDFAVDKTLKPVADIPALHEVTGYFTVNAVRPVFGGRNFISPPNLVLVNSVTNEQVEDVSLFANLDGGSIDSVQIVNSGSGLQGVGHSVFSLINDNGLSITKIDSVQTGIMTLTVVTPVLGFTTNPLVPGDEVFVDGIQEYTGEGDGFNSKDYGFRFFEVTSFNGGINPAEVTIDLSGIGTGSPGVGVTNVNFGSIVKKDAYPTFFVEIGAKPFINNEPLELVNASGERTKINLTVESNEDAIFKTRGAYELNPGDKVYGSVSGAEAVVVEAKRFNAFYDVGYGSTINFGWLDNRGILNEDTQVVPDNDYYQRLAYSIKSPVKYEDLIGPVNRLAHISGTKNFADTEVTSVAVAATNAIKDGTQSLVIDLFNQSDVTTNNFFDFAVDTDVDQNVTNITQVATNSIKFGTKKLTNYIECITNRVLPIDDISESFIDRENLVGTFKDIISFPAGTGYSRFTVIVTDAVDLTSYQVYDVVILSDGNNNSYILEKSNIKSNPQLAVSLVEERESLGEITAFYDQVFGTMNLRFTPTNSNKTYNLKAFRQLFDSRSSGIGSVIIGDTRVIGVTTSVGAGSTEQIVGLASSEFNSAFAYVEILDEVTSERQYAEVSVLHDGVNGFIADYGFDTSDRLLNYSPIGTFGVNYDTSGTDDVVKLEFHNNVGNPTLVKSNVIGFTTTSVGIRSTFFKLTTQADGTERTARLESNVIEETMAGYGITVVGITSLFDRVSKSIIRVSSGNTQSMSQVMMTQEAGQRDIFVLEYPQLGVNTATGLGTFTSEYDGIFAKLLFKPDSKFAGDQIRIEEFSEIIYGDQDTNILAIDEFGAGTVIEEVIQSIYTPQDRNNFTLAYEGYPIFARRFNPGNTSVFDSTTGNIFLESHFLNSGQNVKYSPGSTIIGINSESITIGSTTAGGGDVIGDIRDGVDIVSAASTNTGIAVGDEFFGPGVAAGATIVSIGNTFRFFLGDSDGTKVITGIANTTVIAIGDTIRELVTETGFGTVTAIGDQQITVENNVPVGVGSTYYSERLGIGITMSAVATATTSRQSYFSGFTTNVLPEDLFVIRVDNNNIKLATKKDFALKNIGIEPTGIGAGNNHLIDTTKKLEKSLIILDGVVQAPISRTLVTHTLIEDLGVGNTFIPLSGISTLVPDYILLIDDEFMNIQNVGLGTTGAGPITGVGTFQLANVQRGFVGTKAVTHSNQTEVIVHRGAFNIVESDIHFVDTPRGAGGDFITDERGLPFTRSDFSGRVYLRNDYTTNELYDDVSPEFTGVGRTFALTVDGGNYPVGLDTSSGSGLLFINGVHQGQSTDNNPLNVYTITSDEDNVNVEFSGTKLLSGDPYISDLDAVKNQLPNGGVIVSIASSGGLGIAPLVGAKVIANVNAAGTITDIIGFNTVGTYTTITDFIYDGVSGIGTVTTDGPHGFKYSDFIDFRNIQFDCTSGYDSLVGVSTLDYDHVSGIMTVTTSDNHNLNKDMRVKFRDIEMECSKGDFDTTYSVVNAVYDETTGTLNITPSAPHDLNIGMSVRLSDLEFSCASPHLGVTTTIFPDGTNGRIFNEVTSVVSDTEFVVNVGISTIAHTFVSGGLIEVGITTTKFPSDLGVERAISAASYTESSGALSVTTRRNHNVSTGDIVRLSDLEFSCSSEHAGVTTTIFPDTVIDEFEVTNVFDSVSFEINVGVSTIAHTFVGASRRGFMRKVKYADSYLVQSVVGPTTFVANVNPVGFAHTYVSGGIVETGFTTTRFPDNRGIPFAISNFEYDKTTGFSTITLKKDHSGLAIGDVINLSGIAMTCLAYDNEIGLYDFDYTASTGVSTILTLENHGLSDGDLVMIRDVEFTCSSEHLGVTTTIFPDGTQGFIFNVNAGSAGTTLVTNVGISTIDHEYVSGTGKIRTGITTSIFPDGTQGFEYKIFDLPSDNQIITNVGISTIDHIYDDHGIVFGVKSVGPYEIDTILSDTQFMVDVFKVGFAHTFVPNRRRGGVVAEAAKFNYLSFGSGYFGNVDIEVEEAGHSGAAATITATIPDNVHIFVSATDDGVTRSIGGTLTVSDANYDPVTGILTLTFTGSHGLTTANTIRIADRSITFTCAQDNHQSTHPYPRPTDPASDTDLAVLSTPTATQITVNVGTSSNSTGGTLEFTIVGGGSGYTNPVINIPDPSYGDLPIEGVNRLGIGATTETGKGLSVDCIVGSAATVGFGTDLFGVTNYALSRPGFAFKKGDIFKPVGLVTAAGITTGYEEFTLEVIDVLNDTFSSWNFGQIDYIDSIKSLQDGTRTRFPLNLNGNPLSFQTDPTNQRSVQIDLDSVLLLFVNGVVQVPKKDYFFEGGTSFNFNFTSPPGASDEISIYFYRGTRGVDSFIVTVFETVKPGDEVQLKKYDGTDTITQDERTIFSIKDSTDIETNVYRNQGIDADVFRPISFTRQKRDIVISEQIQPKIRESLEAQVMPTTKIIKDFSASDTEIFVESANLFRYEQDDGNTGLVVADGFIVNQNEPVAASVTATVSTAGTISALTIVDGGAGYADGAVEISIANPPRIDRPKYGIVGVGSTAILSASASGGIVTSVSIDYEGVGYQNTNPQVIVELQAAETDTFTDSDVILGYAGIITGIGTTTGTGSHPLALKFQVDLSDSGPVSLLPTLLEGYPIFVKDTVTGNGVTSVNADDSAVVGVGTTVLNNIYIVNGFHLEGNTGIITCNIKSDTDTVGIATTTGSDIGEFSWGRLANFTRSTDPISLTVSGNTVDVGLSSFPSLSRRGLGLRNTGSLNKIIFL